MEKMKPEDIARVCHEANRAYCRSISDYSHKPWDDAPEIIRNSAVSGVEYAIAHPEMKPGESHQKWLEYKRNEGWRWGPKKDIELREHPNMLDYEDLPEEERKKDELFLAIVRALS